MPTYDYQCRSCGSVTEVIHSMTEEGPSACERCGGELRRVLYPAGIIFKGSGFYRTDSRNGGSTLPAGDKTPSGTGGKAAESSGGGDSGDGGGTKKDSGATKPAGDSSSS